MNFLIVVLQVHLLVFGLKVAIWTLKDFKAVIECLKAKEMFSLKAPRSTLLILLYTLYFIFSLFLAYTQFQTKCSVLSCFPSKSISKQFIKQSFIPTLEHTLKPLLAIIDAFYQTTNQVLLSRLDHSHQFQWRSQRLPYHH